MELSRRELLKLGAFGSAALLLPAERVARTELAIKNRIATSRLPAPFSVPLTVPPVLAPVRSTADTDFYALTQQAAPAAILPGLTTTIWGYNGIAPGPTIVVPRGRKTVVRQVNALPKIHPTLRYPVWTSTHLHGSASLPQFDGYASDITNVGQFKDYQYPNVQEARTIWYHDHGVDITAPNAYMGLAAMYILHDDLEQSLPLPRGRYEVPLVLKDAMFTNTGELIFDDNGGANGGSGLFGDVILVNGKPWPKLAVERRKYRFRMLNASISRSYKPALSTGDPFVFIATDGGLMPTPQVAPSFRFGMAERYEVIIDFAKYPIGTRVVMRNLQPPNNEEFPNTDVIMAFDVTSDATDTTNNVVPAVLNPDNATMALQPAQATKQRLMEFKRDGGEWTVNGRTWEDVINSGFTLLEAHPGLNDVEIWTFKNDSGGWFHPIHVHLIDFKVLDRNGRPPFAYERGPKDVVYLGEGETVRVIARFGPNLGRYMMHCHNLVHEDHDMMVQFEVGNGGPDPITAAPAQNLPAPPL
jgi:spore coat protein A, manganese oxidase